MNDVVQISWRQNILIGSGKILEGLENQVLVRHLWDGMMLCANKLETEYSH